MRSLKLILMVVMLSMALLVSGAAFADRYSGGSGQRGGYSGGGSHKGGYYGGGGYKGGHYGGRGYYGGYYGGRGYYGGYYGSGLGVWFGWPGGYYPYNYPYYYPYYSPYYYPPAVSVPSAPQEYIGRSQRDDSSAPSGEWYYCPESKSYYPYVKECPGGWQTVPAQPPANPRR